MSVAILISETDDTKDCDYKPLSTERFWKKAWVPACEALGLEQFLEFYYSSMTITPEDITTIQEEVCQLRGYFEKNLPEDDQEYVLRRLGVLEKTLEECKTTKHFIHIC